MAKKQTSTKATNNEPVAAAMPARAAKPTTPRARTAKHSKATSIEPATAAAEEPVAAADVTVEEVLVIVAESPEVSAPSNENRREAIAKIAYGYWAARGFQGGNPLEDWVRAEREYGLV